MRGTDLFPDLDADGIRTLISRSRLRDDDARIAELWLVRGMPQADIGAEVNLDRSTVGYRLRVRVLPRLKLYNDKRPGAV